MDSLGILDSTSMPVDVTSCIHFMRSEERHKHEKPYAFRFVATTPIPPTNFVLEPNDRITIQDMRDTFHNFSIQKNGFAILEMPHSLPYECYDDPQRVKTYLRMLEVLLKEHLAADRVDVFRHSVRKRHPHFPISTGNSYDYDQPTSVAHIDTTPEYTMYEASQRYESEGQSLAYKRIQWINVWKPLRGPLNDWPLAVCDTQSVDPDRDYERADLLFEHHVAENFQVHHHPEQRWYYLSDHLDHELIVFKQSDSDARASPGVAHSSFFNSNRRPDEAPRESIEARALVFYE